MKNIQFKKNSTHNLHIEDSFYSGHQKLRSFFETQFENPLHAHSKRFCWDYWNVPDQYRLLRTPAQDFFGEKLFQPFLQHLLSWGRANLGCQMISHPWLSAYVNDCYQDLHSDVPHGPWSFVYSLTPWKSRTFTGGETFMAKPKLLNYFQKLRSHESDEVSQLIQKIPPLQNRLTVFDPRYPHGVTRVNGVEDILDSRLVIHGWFTEPRPMIEGALTIKKAMSSLDKIAEYLLDVFSETDLSGVFCVRIRVASSGKISAMEVVTAHLIHSETGATVSQAWLKKMLTVASTCPFPKSSGATIITLPIELKQ